MYCKWFIICLDCFDFIPRYAIVWKKGYQEFDTGLSAVTTKLKGTSLVNFTGFKSPLLNGMHIFDPADYVIPPQVWRHFHFIYSSIQLLWREIVYYFQHSKVFSVLLMYLWYRSSAIWLKY